MFWEGTEHWETLLAGAREDERLARALRLHARGDREVQDALTPATSLMLELIELAHEVLRREAGDGAELAREAGGVGVPARARPIAATSRSPEKTRPIAARTRRMRANWIGESPTAAPKRRSSARRLEPRLGRGAARCRSGRSESMSRRTT